MAQNKVFPVVEAKGVWGIAVTSPHLTDPEIMNLLGQAFELVDEKDEGLNAAFIDLAPTRGLIDACKYILDCSGKVCGYYDHHYDGNHGQDLLIHELSGICKQLVVLPRAQHPSCVSLIEPGQWLKDGVNVVFFHSDGDGLLSFITGLSTELRLKYDAEYVDGMKATRGRPLSRAAKILKEHRYRYSIPMYTLDPLGNVAGVQAIFQTICTALLTNDQEALAQLLEQVLEAASIALDNAYAIARHHQFLEGNVVYIDTLPAIYERKHVHFPSLFAILADDKYKGKPCLFVTTGLGFIEGKMTEVAFIELHHSWHGRGPDLRKFYPPLQDHRRTRRIQIPLDQWACFYLCWRDWARKNLPK